MNRKNSSRSMLAMLVSTSLAVGVPAMAQMGTMSDEQMQQMMQQRGYGPGGGMGMMGPGMGMMGGGMMDMMMSGGGMGMMGMGPGMMGGGLMDGMGMGMMGFGPIWLLDLTDEQRQRITKIQDDVRKKHWEVMGKIMEEHNKLRDLYQADELDAKKIGAVYDGIAKLRRQMVETHVQAINQARAALTKKQREQLKQWRHGGRGMMGPGGGMGPGMGGRMGPGGMGPGMNR